MLSKEFSNAKGRAMPVFDKETENFYENHGLLYDCPGFANLYEYAISTVLGSVSGIDALIQENCKVAINWAGGWHHAKPQEASGFCYFNDIVIAIKYLQTKKPKAKILYIDLDLHHGDAVQNAFWNDARVLTFSVHHYAPGFFPCSGSSELFAHTAYNFPLNEGCNDSDWRNYVLPVLNQIRTVFEPTHVVLQLGADSLSNDPFKIFSLSVSADGGYASILRNVISWNIPCLVLGGGGYNFADTARLWTILTNVCIQNFDRNQADLADDIPDTCRSFNKFGPDFSLNVVPLPRINRNTNTYLALQRDRLLKQILEYKAYQLYAL